MGDKKAQVRVRYAPSPTGLFHLGGARTALFNWIFARKNNGKFILRIEDTDRERSKKEYEDNIFESLLWLGLDWDEGPVAYASNQKSSLKDQKYIGEYGPYRQSERTHIYRKYLEKLLEEGKAYYCYCTKEELESERQAMLAQGLPPKYSGHCRESKLSSQGKPAQIIRFKVPEAKVEFKDLIRGKVVFDAALFGDIAIAKDLNNPLYNFAVVVDDEEMEISHVIRGEEHLSNTPKQILFQKALKFREPIYAHVPLILSQTGGKLSKRHAETSLLKYREDGYLPETIINFLVLLGWHPKDNREIFSLSELVKEFDIKRVQKSGAIFSQEKLDWMNSQYIKKSSNEELLRCLEPFLKTRNITPKKEFLLKVIEEEKTRINNLKEFFDVSSFFFSLPDYKPSLLVWKNEPPEKIKNVLKNISETLEKIEAENFKIDRISQGLNELAVKEGKGAVFWPLRVALSGLPASPDPLKIAEILGKEETMRRIKIAIEFISRI